MIVAFTDISKAGNRYQISADEWIEETGLKRSAPVEASLALNRQGDQRVAVQGSLRTGVELDCDRCLAGYDFAVDVAFQLLLEIPSAESWQVKELECGRGDLDTVQLIEPEVDIDQILREQLLLSLPEKQICSPACKGLCLQCGVDLNRKKCGCVPEEKESPFAVLAALKND